MSNTDDEGALDLTAIKARAKAATHGPWRWFGDTDVNSVYLATLGGGRRYVMLFKRWGMRDAQPMFQGEPGSPMVKASDMVRYEVCPTATSRADPRVYRGDIGGINHPDAEFIAHARSDIPALISEVERLRERCRGEQA